MGKISGAAPGWRTRQGSTREACLAGIHAATKAAPTPAAIPANASTKVGHPPWASTGRYSDETVCATGAAKTPARSGDARTPSSEPINPHSAASASTMPRIIGRLVPTARKIPWETRRLTTAAAAVFPTKNIPTISETRLSAVRFSVKALSMTSTWWVRRDGGAMVTSEGRIAFSLLMT